MRRLAATSFVILAWPLLACAIALLSMVAMIVVFPGAVRVVWGGVE